MLFEPTGIRLGSTAGRAVQGIPPPPKKKPGLPDERPRLGRVDVGDPALLRKWALALGGRVEDPRLGEGGDNEPPRRRAFVGVDDVGDVLGERKSSLRAGASGCSVGIGVGVGEDFGGVGGGPSGSGAVSGAVSGSGSISSATASSKMPRSIA